MGKISSTGSHRIEIWLAETSHAIPHSTTFSTYSNILRAPRIPFLAKLLPKTGRGERVNEFEKTDMYRVYADAEGKEHARAKAKRDGGDDEENMAIGRRSTEDWVEYSDDGRGLRAKKERLERAARLLKKVQGGS
jgi:hypothetical protein